MKIPYHNAWKPKPTLQSVWIFQAFKVGCPIRRSMDQSLFAAPHGFSQRITSFIACACQGIHQMPLRHLIVLIANAHPDWSLSPPARCALRAVPSDSCGNLAIARTISAKARLPFTTGHLRCHRRVRSGPSSRCHAERHPGRILKTSFSRQIRGCAVRQHPPDPSPDKAEAPNSKRSFKGIAVQRTEIRINLLFTIYAKQASASAGANPYFFGKTVWQPKMVEPSGIEPPTSAVRLRRSPS